MSTHTFPLTNDNDFQEIEVVHIHHTIDFGRVPSLAVMGALLLPFGTFFQKTNFKPGEYCSTQCGPFHVMAANDCGLAMVVSTDNDQGTTLPLVVVRFNPDGLYIEQMKYPCVQCEVTYPEDCANALGKRMMESVGVLVRNSYRRKTK